MRTTDELVASAHIMKSSGLSRVVAFNWPKYVAAISLAGAGVVLAVSSQGLLGAGSALLFAVLTYGIVSSLIATWWVYDYKAADLYRAVASEYQAEAKWILVHAGLDESCGRLEALIGAPDQQIDVGPSTDQSPSLQRAHRLVGRTGQRWDGRIALETASMGFAVVLFGIHELVPADADVLLRELERVVRVGGSIVIVEHLRDVRNALVFGPAALHFSPQRRWLDSMAQAGLSSQGSKRVASLVTVFRATPTGTWTR
jgi:SAM-dependent methyltransferase